MGLTTLFHVPAVATSMAARPAPVLAPDNGMAPSRGVRPHNGNDARGPCSTGADPRVQARDEPAIELNLVQV